MFGIAKNLSLVRRQSLVGERGNRDARTELRAQRHSSHFTHQCTVIRAKKRHMRDMARSAERKTTHSPNTPPGPPASISCRKQVSNMPKCAQWQSGQCQTDLPPHAIQRIYLRTEKPTRRTDLSVSTGSFSNLGVKAWLPGHVATPRASQKSSANWLVAAGDSARQSGGRATATKAQGRHRAT